MAKIFFWQLTEFSRSAVFKSSVSHVSIEHISNFTYLTHIIDFIFRLAKTKSELMIDNINLQNLLTDLLKRYSSQYPKNEDKNCLCAINRLFLYAVAKGLLASDQNNGIAILESDYRTAYKQIYIV